MKNKTATSWENELDAGTAYIQNPKFLPVFSVRSSLVESRVGSSLTISYTPKYDCKMSKIKIGIEVRF